MHAHSQPELILVCCADQNFAMPLAVLLCSAAENLSRRWRLRLCVIDGGMDSPTRQRLERVADRLGNVRIEFLTADFDANTDLSVTDTHTLSCYLRLLIASALPAGTEKAIYLDCDMVVEADLSELWRMEFDGAAIMAVRDFGYPTIKQGLPNTYRQLNLDGAAPYFNSGLMVIDLDRWRKLRIPEQVLSYTRRFAEHVHLADQDGLNAALCGKWKPLDLSWNVQVGSLKFLASVALSEDSDELLARRDELLAHPQILHFVSGHKPWHGGRYRPVRGRFVHYLHRSGWLSTWGKFRFHATWFAKTARMAMDRPKHP